MCRPKKHGEQADTPVGLEGEVREKSVVAERDAQGRWH